MGELDQYDYHLPRHLIAQSPTVRRADARLLVVCRSDGSFEHRHVRDLPVLLCEGDCLVINDTRVLPARLVGRRATTGGHWEGLFLEAGEGGLWRVMGKTRGKVARSETIILLNAEGRDDTGLVLAAQNPDGSWVAKPQSDEEPFHLLDRVGRIPLPPYIRKGEMVESDREDYQTVYARHPGAVAAPTAGLHFTQTLLRQLIDIGVTIGRLTLHVGPGTFRPVTTETLAEHRMHSEWGCVEQQTIDEIERCRARGGRVMAVGTTSVRLLETAAAGGVLRPYRGSTDLFIRPPFRFNVVDALLTNFHLPRTTLLVLVRTFGGDELIGRAYEEAIREQYRFYSYGDAMLIL